MIKEERAIAPIIGGYHMMTIWDKAVLFLCCTIHLFYYSDRVTPVCVVGFLAAFCAACLFTYWNPDHEQPPCILGASSLLPSIDALSCGKLFCDTFVPVSSYYSV